MAPGLLRRVCWCPSPLPHMQLSSCGSYGVPGMPGPSCWAELPGPGHFLLLMLAPVLLLSVTTPPVHSLSQQRGTWLMGSSVLCSTVG